MSTFGDIFTDCNILCLGFKQSLICLLPVISFAAAVCAFETLLRQLAEDTHFFCEPQSKIHLYLFFFLAALCVTFEL